MVFGTQKLTGDGSSVMMVVATSFDAPIKILMPHLTADLPTKSCSLLGLGDIVIPGLYMGFLVRFGRLMTGSNQQSHEKDDLIQTETLNRKPTLAYTIVGFSMYALALTVCGICLVVYR